MKKVPFPVNYFQSIIHPAKAFANRRSLTVLQLVIVFIFLNMLLINPIVFHAAAHPAVQLQDVMPGVVEQLDDQTFEHLQQVLKDGAIPEDQPAEFMNDQQTVGVNLTQTQFDGLTKGINVTHEAILLKSGSAAVFTVPYSKTFDWTKPANSRELQEAVSQEWQLSNRVNLMLTTTAVSGGLIVVSNFLIVLGVAAFVWLTRMSSYSAIRTYKESVNLILNCLGLSSLAAMITGFVQFDVIVMMMVQSFGMVLMLLAVFAKTKFQDKQMIKMKE
ncbi:hypothetical protein [Vagococcus acidifermentans]|uniref:Maltodextrose utilization protein MalA n=1 Tax=Vagococcus acidifermentans TaxID=564710 RepID=A0A430ATQ4_9ENTE|nr:hypothetical protein [Vagococcus acidifermentans]RSU11449.1 hypothetical protein CBF27_08090 [Vagococcus acidifermentans]